MNPFKNTLIVGLIGFSCLASFNSSAVNPDFSRVVAVVDQNQDGKMTRKEWQTAGLPESSFNMFECKRGYVTQDDYVNNAAPPGIDQNGDGYLTVEEFIAFDKSMSMNGPPPNGPDGPPPMPTCN